MRVFNGLYLQIYLALWSVSLTKRSSDETSLVFRVQLRLSKFGRAKQCTVTSPCLSNPLMKACQDYLTSPRFASQTLSCQ